MSDADRTGRLDDVDLALLRALQRNGRATAEALSELVHLSARATLARVRALEKAGWILGYRAMIEPDAMGAHVVAIAQVTMRDQRRAAAAAFELRMRQSPQVLACDLVSGAYDYLVRVCCTDLAHYQAITGAWLEDASLGIHRIVTSTQLERIKEFDSIPL